MQRTQIDLALLEPARTIAARLGGEAIDAAEWDVFFGRAGGAMLWQNLRIIKQSYEQAMQTRAAFRRKRRQSALVCMCRRTKFLTNLTE